MKIAIDARSISHPQVGGFKSYTSNLVAAMIENFPENQYTLYFDREFDMSDELSTRFHSPTGFIQRTIGNHPVIREQFLLPKNLRSEAYDLVHFPTGTCPIILNIPMVITIHDMIEFFEKVPESLPFKDKTKRYLMRNYIRIIQTIIARKSSIIITVSEYSKKDIMKRLGVPEMRIRVAPNAQSDIFFPKEANEIREFRNKFGLPEKFLLCIGSASPRKNIVNLLEIYSLIPQEIQKKYPLVIMWSHPLLKREVHRRIQELGITTSVRFLSSVNDNDLVLLYNCASLFVFPSTYEGFGLPILEAMACGVPVVASNLTSIPEVAGDAAILVDPNDKRGFSNALVQLLFDEEKQNELIGKGIKRSGLYSWEKSAQATINVYKEIIENQNL